MRSGWSHCGRFSINRPFTPEQQNALLAFVDQGYLARTDGKYVLPESYATADAVHTIEARLASFS